MNLYRAVATVGGFTLLSRITGFLRDILLARMLGAGMAADAFFVAFKFPNLFRRLFAEGAFSAAFVPMFAKKLEGDGETEAKVFLENVFSGLALILLLLVVAMELAMPWAIIAFAPGFSETPGKLELATDLARVAFPYLFFVALVSLMSGVLNAFGKFAAAAAAPVLLNICLITAALGYGTLWHGDTAGHVLVWGVSAAGLAQFFWLLYHTHKIGMGPGLVLPSYNRDVKTLFKRILPGVIGMGVYQINLVVDTVVASLVSEGAVSWLYYADRINQLPLGVVGIAMGTALLPMLSRQIRADNLDAAYNTQNRGIEFALLLTLPAAAGLICLATPIISVLFERGAFLETDSIATANALMAFAVGLPAFVLVKVLVPGFFAREDTVTPVRIAIICLFVNVILVLSLMKPFGHVGIAIATAISAWVNASLLAILLHRRNHLYFDERLKSRVLRIVLATGAMAAILTVVMQWSQGHPAITDMSPWLLLLFWIVVGKVSFLLSAFVLKVTSKAEIKAMLRRSS